MIKIITDSSANFTREEAEKLGLTVVPLGVSFGTEEYLDGVNLSTDEFYNKLTSSKEFPHTSMPSEDYLKELFAKSCAEGDEVLVMFIARALSGTYDLAKRVEEESGMPNIRVYGTDATTTILKTLVLEAAKNAQKPIDEVIAILDNLRPRIKLFAALDTLEYLKKGGRLSGAASFFGSLMHIKPIIIHDTDGTIKLVGKQIGMSLALKSLAEKVDAGKIDFSYPVYFLYTMDDCNCNAMIKKLKLPSGEKINICPVIGTHIGPAGAGISYVEKA